MLPAVTAAGYHLHACQTLPVAPALAVAVLVVMVVLVLQQQQGQMVCCGSDHAVATMQGCLEVQQQELRAAVDGRAAVLTGAVLTAEAARRRVWGDTAAATAQQQQQKHSLGSTTPHVGAPGDVWLQCQLVASSLKPQALQV